MNEVMILLPEYLPILRSRPRASNPVDPEDFRLYFENFVYPLKAEYDVITDCAYGGNFGAYWGISAFPEDTDEFPLTVKVYDEWGKLLNQRTAVVQLIQKAVNPPEYRVLPFGDSMTHRHTYVDRLALKIANLRTVGTRSFNGTVFHEGRGGWTLGSYLNNYADGWGGTSPFLFPVNVSGPDYYGDMSFRNRLKTPDLDSYSLDGYIFRPIREGQVFLEEGRLWKFENESKRLFDENPVFEFNFAKYIARNGLPRPDAVSVLMGANDVQNTPYEQTAQSVARFVNELDVIIASVHEYDKAVDIIVNLPVPGAEQFAWGLIGNSSAKRYRLNTVLLTKALIEHYDCRTEEHIHICPMRLFTDPVHGFTHTGTPANTYCDTVLTHQNNWVHPGLAGYNQMGDILASTIEKLRQQTQAGEENNERV